MYVQIFDQLDFYSKVSYALYLKDISEINFIEKLSPTDDDLCELIEFGINKIEFVNKYVTISKNKLINAYINNFRCVKVFAKLIDPF